MSHMKMFSNLLNWDFQMFGFVIFKFARQSVNSIAEIIEKSEQHK